MIIIRKTEDEKWVYTQVVEEEAGVCVERRDRVQTRGCSSSASEKRRQTRAVDVSGRNGMRLRSEGTDAKARVLPAVLYTLHYIGFRIVLCLFLVE